MRTWAFFLGGMIIWAAHFFALYAIASLFLTSPIARWLTLAATLGCAAAALGLLIVARQKSAGSDTDNWLAQLSTLFAGGALIAVLWQGLPALII